MDSQQVKNETERLRALKEFNILDTLPEQAFDDIAHLASYICETPIALISLVDEKRQWFKSKIGLDASETPREVAFCATAINLPEILVVKDTTKDERFASNPLVTSDPHIRFYAGAQLVTSNGLGLGTLCVIDRKPRELRPAQIEALKALSRQVMQMLEARLIAQKLAEAKNDLVYLREEILSEYNFGEIIGNSEALKQTLRKTQQVSATNTTVLIVGETGTGKELIARAIHNGSPRKNRPMIKVNCAALPANLIESELFGHEKGAFTGAHSVRMGRFEMANGSTIFLDEIGELPLELQAKLLRVLQEGEFERLGSSRTIKIDVRVIAATNRDLEAASREGVFRSDLYYRLSVFPITLPPLRERKEDIQLLVSAFIERENKRLGKNIQTISRETIGALQNYPWYGNIRELQSVIERAAIISESTELELADTLKSHPHLETAAPDKGFIKGKISSEIREDGNFLPFDEMERRYILKVLEKTRWRIHGKGGAAEILDLNPNTLRSKMQKLGIKRPI